MSAETVGGARPATLARNASSATMAALMAACYVREATSWLLAVGTSNEEKKEAKEIDVEPGTYGRVSTGVSTA